MSGKGLLATLSIIVMFGLSTACSKNTDQGQQEDTNMGGDTDTDTDTDADTDGRYLYRRSRGGARVCIAL